LTFFLLFPSSPPFFIRTVFDNFTSGSCLSLLLLSSLFRFLANGTQPGARRSRLRLDRGDDTLSTRTQTLPFFVTHLSHHTRSERISSTGDAFAGIGVSASGGSGG
jgi:hypothetical protein